ncbi:MAG: hypothetical protein LUF82_04145 [Clostridia bacterium]|nr:hypothetical protein [Clostridia bacterium]
MIESFTDSPVSERKEQVKGRQYKVVSHYTGKKDLDMVIKDLAEKRAYKEFAG